MTPIQLVYQLTDRIRDIVKDYALEDPGKGKALRSPLVYAQALPERMYEDDPDPGSFPFVLVVLGGGVLLPDSEGNCAVGIMLGAHEDSLDQQGWLIPAELAWRILTDLVKRPALGPYKLQFPIEWTLPDPRDQPKPLYFGNISLTWELPVPKPLGSGENPDLLPSGLYDEDTYLQT